MRYHLAFAVLALLISAPSLHPQQVKLGLKGELTDAVACDGIVYFGAHDGKLYGVRAADGTAAPGFPVDTVGAMGDGSYPYTRPAVYWGSLGKAIYLETNKHGLVKVWPDGRIAWGNGLDGAYRIGGGMTPAVTPDGSVIAEMKTASNVFIVRLSESDGKIVMMSPPLSQSYRDFLSAPAVVGGSIYTSVEHPADGRDIVVLNMSDLTIRATLMGTGADWSPPYVRGTAVFMGCSASFYSAVSKFNAVTLTPDMGFGNAGTVEFDTGGYGAYSEVVGSPPSANRSPAGTVYASVANNLFGKLVGIDVASGNVSTLATAGTGGTAGMVVSSRAIVAYGTVNTFNMFAIDGSALVSVPLAVRPKQPAYDPTTNRFFVTTQPDTTGTSYLMGFDSP